LQELAEQPVMSYDPLPPSDSIDTYKRTENGGSGKPNLDDPSVLGMFFRSLLPNFDPNATNVADGLVLKNLIQLSPNRAAPSALLHGRRCESNERVQKMG
jgi:hypothetical protein